MAGTYNEVRYLVLTCCSPWNAWATTLATTAAKVASACHRAFRLDILRVRGPSPGGVHLAGLELFAAC